MVKNTIWKAIDRRGTHYFSSRPTYTSGHDVFNGTEIGIPSNRKSYRLLTKFNVKVTGMMMQDGIYPERMRVGYA